MTKKKKSSKADHVSQLEALQAALCAKDAQVTELQQALTDAEQRAVAAEQGVAADARLNASIQELLAADQQAAARNTDYENRVLSLELQSLVERHHILDVEELAEQNHELSNEVMRLQAENMEMSRALAESGQRSRRDVARIQLALEATARDVMGSMRKRLAAEMHAQLDTQLRTLVEDHGSLQESMVSLAQQAAKLDRQVRSLTTDRRQFKIDAEVGQSMSGLQSRQIVLLKSQVERMALALQMAQVKAHEQTARAEAADGRAAAATHALSELQASNQRLRHQVAVVVGAATAAGAALPHLVDDASLSEDGGIYTEVQQLGRRLTVVQQQLDGCNAACQKWRNRANMYERACAQLQAVLTSQASLAGYAVAPRRPAGSRRTTTTPATQAPADRWPSPGVPAPSPSCPDMRAIWCADPAEGLHAGTAGGTTGDASTAMTHGGAAVQGGGGATVAHQNGRHGSAGPCGSGHSTPGVEPSGPLGELSCLSGGKTHAHPTAEGTPVGGTPQLTPDPTPTQLYHPVTPGVQPAAAPAPPLALQPAVQSQSAQQQLLAGVPHPTVPQQPCPDGGGTAGLLRVSGSGIGRPSSAVHTVHNGGAGMGAGPPAARRPHTAAPTRSQPAAPATTRFGSLMPHCLATSRALRGTGLAVAWPVRSHSATAAAAAVGCDARAVSDQGHGGPGAQHAPSSTPGDARQVPPGPAGMLTGMPSGLSPFTVSRLHSKLDVTAGGGEPRLARPGSARDPFSPAAGLAVRDSQAGEKGARGGTGGAGEVPRRPRTALQPRGLRPGSARYFSTTVNDPFLAMEAELLGS